MKKTPQEFKRDNIRSLFEKTLKSKKAKLEPMNITVQEFYDSSFTSVQFAIKELISNKEAEIEFSEKKAKGFVDGIFRACKSRYTVEFPSLNNIRLTDYQVIPEFNKAKCEMRTDAKTKITLMVDVKNHGIAEFNSTSRSILHSSFFATLKAFQFYINSEMTFHQNQIILEDAMKRNRGDIVQSCMTDLSKLTEVNNYVKKERPPN